MKIIKRSLVALLALSTITAAYAQKETPPPGSTPKDFTLPGKKEKSLANGLKINMVKYGDVPKVNINLIIKTGNVHEAANEVWLADLTGDMMKQGSKTINFKELAKKVAAMGGDINVGVGPDQFTISGAVLSEFAPAFIGAVADIVMNPAFPAGEIERLKDDLKRQLTYQKSVPQSQAQEKFNQAMFKNHPYGRYFPTEKMLDSYTLAMVKDFYNKNFGAKRSVIYVVGNFDEAAVNTAIDKAFSKWKPGPAVSYPPVAAASTRDTLIIDRKDAPQTTVMLGLPVLTPKDKDYLAQSITNSLLGGSFGSRITRNIREDKGYTYSPFSTIQNRQGASIWYEQADVTSEHTVSAIREIEKEVKKLQADPPSKEELLGIQNYAAGIFVLQNSSPGGIIGQLNFLDQYGLDDSYLTDRVKNIYKITPEKVTEIAKNYLKYENMTFILVGDKQSINTQVHSKKGF